MQVRTARCILFTVAMLALLVHLLDCAPTLPILCAFLDTVLALEFLYFAASLQQRVLFSSCPLSITSAWLRPQSGALTSCPSVSYPGSQSLPVGVHCKVGHMCATESMSSPTMH